MTITYDAQGLDPAGYMCCPTCGTAQRPPHCQNPGCDANPSIRDADKATRRARRDAAAAEEAERQRIRDIQTRMMRRSP